MDHCNHDHSAGEDCRHHNGAPATPMLPGSADEHDIVYITPMNGRNGKILIREDTILANLQGCAGCGRAQFSCQGVKQSWSSLCWGQHSYKSSHCCEYACFVAVGCLGCCFSHKNSPVIKNKIKIKYRDVLNLGTVQSTAHRSQLHVGFILICVMDKFLNSIYEYIF